MTTRVLTTRSPVCLAPSGLPHVFVFANYSDSLAPALLLQPATLPAATAIIGIGWFAAPEDELLHDYLQPQPPRHQRRRTVYDPVSPWSSNWGRMLKSKSCRNPNTKAGNKFRRRFRMPAAEFDRAVAEIKVCPPDAHARQVTPDRPFHSPPVVRPIVSPIVSVT